MSTGSATVERARDRKSNRKSGPGRLGVALRWLLPILLIVAWAIYARSASDLVIPTPAAVLAAFWQMVTTGQLVDLLMTSNQALLFGTLLSLGIGIPFGILLGRYKTFDSFFGVFISISLAAPTIAFLPIVIIVFGLDLKARVVFVFLFTFDLVVSIVRNGVRNIQPEFIEMATCFAANTRQMWLKVLLPGMIPSLAAALRIAITRGLVGMVIIELTLTAVGIGGFVMLQRAYFRADMVFAGVFVICLEALLLTFIAQRIERRLIPKGLHGVSG